MVRNLKRVKKRIKDLPVSSRPQEKLLSLGAENLSDAELLAILLGTGSAKKNAVVLGKSLLHSLSLQKFSKITPAELLKFSGIGRSKAARILSAVELSERIFAPASTTKITIHSTDDVLANIKDIAGKNQEYLVVLYLNSRHELLKKEIVGQGRLNHMLIDAREIFAPAVVSPCASIILAHNHPSGDSSPSEGDISFTKRIHEAGEVMGIPLIDHVIVTRSSHFSFRDGKNFK